MNWAMLALLSLATYRATWLVTDDDIPLGRLRAWLERKFPKYGWGLGCTYCMSIWTGAGATAFAAWRSWVPREWDTMLVIWFALAGMTILLTSIVDALFSDET